MAHWLKQLFRSTKEADSHQRFSLLMGILGLFFLLTLLNPTSRSTLSQFFNKIESKSFTQRQQQVLESRSNSGIDIVGIDDKTSLAPQMSALFGRYPYNREIFGYLIRFLKRGNPKALLIDIAFDGGEDQANPDSDQLFAQSVHQADFPVLSALSTKFSNRTAQFIMPLPDSFWEKQKYTLTGNISKVGVTRPSAVDKPIQPLLDSPMRFYPVHMVKADLDGVIRRFNPIIIYDNRFLLPVMPLAILAGEQKTLEVLDNGSLKAGNKLFNFKGQSYPIIHWYGDVRANDLNRGIQQKTYPEIYPRYSLWDILYSQLIFECTEQQSSAPLCQKLIGLLPDIKATLLTPDVFNSHYVYIGHTSLQSVNSDTHQSIYPVANYPGVYIQANILDNLMHDDFVAVPPAYWTWLAVLLMVSLSGYTCLTWRSVPLSILFTLALGAIYHQLTFFAYEHWNLWINWVYPMTALLLTFMLSYVYRYRTTEQTKNQLRFAFGKYVSKGVMAAIEKNPTDIQLGGQRRELTMLFCDIRGFTSFSEANDAETVQSILSQYFTVMNSIILNTYNGSINKLMGDAIMAYWGFPLETDDHAYQAVCCALAMRDAIEAWQADPSRPPIKIGIGLNTGPVMIGNVGSQDFMDFTVIGDAVNVASRLEGMNKEFGTTIIISATTYEKVKDRIEARRLGAIKVRGKDQETEIYEPLSLI